MVVEDDVLEDVVVEVDVDELVVDEEVVVEVVVMTAAVVVEDDVVDVVVEVDVDVEEDVVEVDVEVEDEVVVTAEPNVNVFAKFTHGLSTPVSSFAASRSLAALSPIIIEPSCSPAPGFPPRPSSMTILSP